MKKPKISRNAGGNYHLYSCPNNIDPIANSPCHCQTSGCQWFGGYGDGSFITWRTFDCKGQVSIFDPVCTHASQERRYCYTCFYRSTSSVELPCLECIKGAGYPKWKTKWKTSIPKEEKEQQEGK